MSQWTHVNASFRLDTFGRIEDEELINIFGRSIDYWHMNEIEYDEDCEVKDKDKYLPMGSEGTLEMSIWHNPDKSCIASTTVSIFGDLRDYGDYEEIEKWFNKCCDACDGFVCDIGIRQAFCQVDVEGFGTKVFQRGFE